MIGLVEQDDRCGGKLTDEFFEILARCQAACGIVWVANVDQPGRGVGARENSFQIMGVTFCERNFSDFSAQSFCTAADGFEGRQTRNEFFAGAKKSGSGDAQDFSRAAAEHQLFRLDGMRGRDSVMKGADRSE